MTRDWSHSCVCDSEAGAYFKACTIGGQPAVLFADRKTHAIRLAQLSPRKVGTKSVWTISQLPDISGAPLGLVEINGTPAALLSVKDEQKLRTLWYATAQYGPGGWLWDCRQNSATPCLTARLAVVGGKPIVAVLSSFQAPGESADCNRLWVAAGKQAVPTEASDWVTKVVEETTPGLEIADNICFASIDGRPALAWEYLEQPTLRYGWRTVEGEWQSSTVLKWPDYSSGLFLTEYQSRPLIIYSFWAQTFAMHCRTSEPADNRDWYMYFVSNDPGREDLRACSAITIDQKLLVTYFGFEPHGLFISIVDEVPH